MSSYKLDWNQAEFINEVKKNLADNGEIVGKFIESEARKNLLAIQDPAWGRPYRQKIVSRLLMYQVESKSKEVIITVGVAKGSGGSHHGFYIELGSATAPPHPFLRPAVYHNAREIIALLEGK